MTTQEVINCVVRGWGIWNVGALPDKGPYFVRTNENSVPILHADSYIVKAIHGPNCQWSLVND